MLNRNEHRTNLAGKFLSIGGQCVNTNYFLLIKGVRFGGKIDSKRKL